MGRAGIKLVNFIGNIFHLARNRNCAMIAAAEVLVLVFVIYISAVQLGSTTYRNAEAIRMDINDKPTSQKIVLRDSSSLFFSDQLKATLKPSVLNTGLRLTGTGMIKGMNKATVEDKSGNCYYIREGETIGRYQVMKITENRVVISDQSGNTEVLILNK